MTFGINGSPQDKNDSPCFRLWNGKDGDIRPAPTLGATISTKTGSAVARGALDPTIVRFWLARHRDQAGESGLQPLTPDHRARVDWLNAKPWAR